MMAPKVDRERLAAELEADADVLRALAENGDEPTSKRPVDLHFKGSEDAIVALGEDADELGLRFVQYNEYEDGDWSVDFSIDSTVEPHVMARLTERALEIEIAYGVEYDGWGCVAQSGRED